MRWVLVLLTACAAPPATVPVPGPCVALGVELVGPWHEDDGGTWRPAAVRPVQVECK